MEPDARRPAGSTPDDVASQLARLATLHSGGVTSDRELVAATQALLSPPAPSVPPKGDSITDPGVTRSRPPRSAKRRATIIGAISAIMIGLAAGVVIATRSGPEATTASATGNGHAPAIAPSTAATATAPPDPSPSATTSLSPSTGEQLYGALWPEAVDEGVQRRLMKACFSGTGARCDATILELSGSSEVVEFYGETGSFLIGTYPGGPVDIGFLLGPLGANFQASPLVMTPDGEPFSPDELVWEAPLKGDPALQQLRAQFPGTTAWAGGGAEMPAPSADGGTDVTFQFPLTDMCHACEQLGTLRVTFSFDADGNSTGRHEMSVCGIWNFELGIDAPYCPVTIDGSLPSSTSASTPRDAITEFVTAWENRDPVRASSVASSDAVSFLWELDGPDVAAGRCWRSRVWEEFDCSLGFTDMGVPHARVIEVPDGGYVVADAGYSE